MGRGLQRLIEEALHQDWCARTGEGPARSLLSSLFNVDLAVDRSEGAKQVCPSES